MRFMQGILIITLATGIVLPTPDQKLENENLTLLSARSELAGSFHGLSSPKFNKKCATKDPELHKLKETPGMRMLDHFETRLKYFARDNTYDHVGFENKARNLGQELAYINECIRENPFSRPVSEKIRFIREFYQSLVKAAHLFRIYTRKNTGEALVRKILSINIGIYGLRDSAGMLEPVTEESTKKVDRLIGTVHFLQNFFDDLEEGSATSSMRIVFESSIAQTKQSLSNLSTRALKRHLKEGRD